MMSDYLNIIYEMGYRDENMNEESLSDLLDL